MGLCKVLSVAGILATRDLDEACPAPKGERAQNTCTELGLDIAADSASFLKVTELVLVLVGVWN